MKHILVEDLADLRLMVHVIGYKTMGESIVVVLWDNRFGKVLYSMVIDIFQRKDSGKKLRNRTFEILQGYGIDRTKLNLFCWSHPDDDHSRGLDVLLSDYCNDKTRIFVPYGFHDPDFSKVMHNKKDKAFLQKILDLNSTLKLACNPVSVSERESSVMESIYLFPSTMGAKDPKLDIRIEALSPTASLLSHKTLTLKSIPKNEMAIVVVLSIGRVRWVFGSDIMNDEIEHLNEYMLYNPIFVKVPHHGSDSSKMFINKCFMDGESTYACVTSFDKKGLPHGHVLEEYKKQCLRVDFTGSNGPEYWGEVRYEFNFANGGSCDVKPFGDARRIS